MPVVFACATSHTPGIRAWSEAPPAEVRERFFGGLESLSAQMHAARPDAILIISSEHFANFFLDGMPAFTLGQGDSHFGPVEPWLKVEQGVSPGSPELAAQLLDSCFQAGFELHYTHEIKLDHGTIVPLSYLDPDRSVPVIPLIINAMTFPMPTLARCYQLGVKLGEVMAKDERRIAVVAAGGLSHAPGERIHGNIDSEFDLEFLRRLTTHDSDAFTSYTDDELTEKGLGTHEIRTWISLAGICAGRDAEVLFYEQIREWATGCALLSYKT